RKGTLLSRMAFRSHDPGKPALVQPAAVSVDPGRARNPAGAPPHPAEPVSDACRETRPASLRPACSPAARPASFFSPGNDRPQPPRSEERRVGQECGSPAKADAHKR